MPKRDVARGAKLLLLVSSLLTLALLMYAAWDENVAPEWRGYQADYRAQLIAQADTPQSRATAERFSIEHRQLYLPELGRVDRCQTCHVGIEDPTMAAAQQPLATHPGDWLATHPPDRFGCTVCHDGQGRAITIEDAHGDVEHWDRPMLPMRFIKASCGKCHFSRGLTAAPALAQGRRLFEENGCRGCHTLDGVGGTFGPDLSTVARAGGRRHEWLLAHFRDPQSVVPGSAMPRFDLDDKEVEALTTYMLSRTDDRPGGYFLSQRFVPTPEVGQWLFEERGCIGCHSVQGIGGDIGPPLDDVAERRDTDWLFRHFKEPRAVTPTTVMPTFDFTDGEAAALTLFVLSLDSDSAFRPAQIPALRSPVERGRHLYARFGCIGCHGPNGQGGIANPNAMTGGQVPGLLYVAEGYTAKELAQQVRRGQREITQADPDGPRPPLYMPTWEGIVTDAQLDDLTAYLFSLLPEDSAEEDW